MQRNKQVVVNVLTIMALLLATIGLVPAAASIAGIKSIPAAQSTSVQAAPTSEDPTEGFMGILKGGSDEDATGEIEGDPLDRDDAFYSRRTAHDPNVNFTLGDAAVLRAEAAAQLAGQLQNRPAQPASPLAYGGAWTSVGPNPMVLTSRGDNTFDAMAGRIGALAIRSSAPYTMYLGGAQGGVWTMASPYTGTWTPRTDFVGSLAIGAIALAPSNENIVYVGTGEGALSGDSYFGNGVLKSIDGGTNFSHISAASYFTKVSISKIVVNPTDPNTLYAGTLRGRGGNRRTSPPDASSFGVWKSTNGGVDWTEVLTATTNPLDFAGVTDMVMDPQNPQVVYVSMLGVGISKTVDGGVTWTSAMNGLPAGDYAAAPTRFSLGLSRPTVGVSATLYTGFEYYSGATRIASSVWKSTNDANSWSATSTAVIGDYCGSQCWYDNVIAADPISPTVVYALGLYNYGTGSGGIYRSMDGGATWVDLGFNLHPDYHAIAIRNDNPAIVVMGNDGGAWWSSSRGGRLTAGDPITATTWNNLNGLVNPASSATLFRSGLALGQFTSIAANPTVANRFYGGTQDNGTQRKSTANSTWVDVASGDGGQVLLDPTDANYFYGTYFGISPYRFVDGGGLYLGGFTSNESIKNNIPNDRAEFYIPWMMDPANPARLYLGTYRVYRTDNAKTANSADVFWNTISGDLTSGCTGAAANGGRGCYISAFGKSAGSPALYVGTIEGWIWTAADSTVASPTWVRRDISGTTPLRPVSAFAVDRSNYRTAYVAFSGFDLATPATPGHIFKTTNGGQSWTNITNNLPDIPVNSIDVDPSEPNTLYVGTDIGPYVSTDNGATWNPLGTGFPIVTVHQMALNAFTRQLVAATHGRGVWSLGDVTTTTLPALQISKSAPSTPIGPGSSIVYSIQIQNYGNITATNVVITDPVPANTAFVSAGSGGTLVGSNVVWTVPSVAKPVQVATTGSLGVGLVPGSATVTFTVQITNTGVITSGDVITNDGYLAKSAEGPGAVGSPYYVTLSPGYAVSAAPATQFDAARSGTSVLYNVTINNQGFNTDNYNVSASFGAFTATVWNAARINTITQTGNVGPGASVNVVLQVSVPPGAANGVTDTATLNIQSVGNPATTTSVTARTTAVTNDILLVDDDDNAPNISSYYTNALTTAGYSYDYYNLATAPAGSLPMGYLKSHKIVVWFTGMSYPAPLGSYESELTAFLNGGGKLFMSGQDILDQAAGLTTFVHDYLHIDWNDAAQNDIGTVSATSLVTSPMSSGLGVISVTNTAIGMLDYNDQVTPIFPAEAAFLDDTGEPNALQVDAAPYKVVFLAFEFAAMGNAGQRATVMDHALKYLMANNAVTSVGVTGAATAMVNQPYAYTASVLPITSTRPVQYMWMTTDQADRNILGLSSDTATYTWTLRGAKGISVLASNEEGTAMLAGTNSVPAINTAGLGLAYFTYDRMTKMLTYNLGVSNLISVTASHIHTGTASVNGPIAFPFTPPVSGSSSGTVGPFNQVQEGLLFSGGYYVNVHTSSHPGGEIRGQIMFTGGYATTTLNVVVPYLIYMPVIRR